MHSTAIIHEIDCLLKAGGLSHRKIAIKLGVSRGTISALATGRRGLYGKDAPQPHAHASPPTRCPHCGYRVYLPCLICNARQYQLSQSRGTTLTSTGIFPRH